MTEPFTRFVSLALSVLLALGAIVSGDADAPQEKILYSAEEQSFLDALAALEHYDPTREARYLAYLDSEDWTAEQVLRIVNTDNDMTCFDDAVEADTEDGILMLVNKYHYLDKDYVPDDLTDVEPLYSTSGGQLSAEASAAFSELVEALWEEAGLHLVNASPYRSYSTQKRIYRGYCKKDGQEKADRYSARPGYSEHQTGLALDVTAPGGTLGGFRKTEQFAWMKDNAHRFGFILRYEDGMEYITGYKYEPWHYRYVGVDAATFIYENALTFEEYYTYYVEK